MQEIQKMERAANQIRRDSLKMTFRGGNEGGHVAPVLSCADIVAALYLGVMRYRVEEPEWSERDRLILSKGHAVHCLYSILEQVGFLKKEENTYGGNHTRYIGHAPKRFPGVDFATGSMGHGPSVGAGMAMAAKKNGYPSRVFVLCGDGELQEGSVWEAALFAAKNRLDNLTLIVDHNGLQHDSSLEEIMPMGDVCKKFEAFGWDVVQADGHDFSSILEALKPSDRGLPRAVIAKTVKGKGVSFMENVVTWHHGCLNGANEENFRQALRELGEEA